MNQWEVERLKKPKKQIICFLITNNKIYDKSVSYQGHRDFVISNKEDTIQFKTHYKQNGLFNRGDRKACINIIKSNISEFKLKFTDFPNEKNLYFLDKYQKGIFCKYQLLA
jgi:hypothetical protein